MSFQWYSKSSSRIAGGASCKSGNWITQGLKTLSRRLEDLSLIIKLEFLSGFLLTYNISRSLKNIGKPAQHFSSGKLFNNSSLNTATASQAIREVIFVLFYQLIAVL